MDSHINHRVPVDTSAKPDVLRRIAYIEGHLNGVRRMIEEDQYCIDVLKQTYAVRRAIEHVTGEVVVIQDADLEYDPAEYPRLLQPILDNKADAVYGSRFAGPSRRVLFFWHYVGNRFLTLMSNAFTNLNLTDMETCYKVFRREVLEQVTIRENRFGFEPEITAKVAALGCRIYEVGISYSGRTYAEGKKIGWKDGVRALWCILKYNTWARTKGRWKPA